MASSPEYRTLLACTDKLNASLSIDPLGIAGIFLAKGFISSNVESEMRVLALTKHHKASILVEAVRSKVKIDPRTFTAFVDTLSEQTWTRDVVKYLASAYQSKVFHHPVLLDFDMSMDEVPQLFTIIVSLFGVLRAWLRKFQ